MNANIRNRFIVFGIVTLGLFVVLFVQLIHLTLVKGEELAAAAAVLPKRVITVSGARGSILDRSGLPLAYDQKAYNVQFYRDPSKNTETDRAYYTSIIMQTIAIVEKNGGKSVDTFAIKHNDKTGGYYFDWGDIKEEYKEKREAEWRKNMYVTSDSLKTAEQIYLFLRNKYKIPTEMGYEEARKILSIWQDVQLSSWVAYNPVDVAYDVDIQTVAEIETQRAELEGMSIEDSTVRIYPRDAVAAHIIGYLGRITEDTLRDYGIEADAPVGTQTAKSLKDFGYTDEQVSAMLQTVAQKKKEAKNGQASGGLLAMGYSVDDLIGVEGVEKSMEAYLTGNYSERQGRQEVEIDNMAVVQNVLSSTEPSQGYNVMLTLDIPMQMAVEKSLADNIPRIHAAQVQAFDNDRKLEPKKQKYKDIKDISELDLAASGAAVVMKVDTGEVLSMASYPSYDLNLFTGGISDEIYQAFKDDPAAPLFNKAIASRATPGSIFKMVTGLGALMEGKIDEKKGTTLTEEIDCQGTYTEGILESDVKNAPKCWKKHNYLVDHANQTIVEGLEHSCNFYFYTLAGRMGIDLLSKWGEKFGLASSTGIELPGELIGQIGSQKLLYDSSKDINNQASALPKLVMETGPNSVANQIRAYAKSVGVSYTEEQVLGAAHEIVDLMGIQWHTIEQNNVALTVDDNDVTIGQHIRDILFDELGISKKVSLNLSREIAGVLTELQWTPTRTVATGIGQGITAVTPIAVARYVAAVVNGGTVYQANIVDKIVAQDGTVVLDKQPEVFGSLDAPPEFLNAIIKGMSSVVSAEEGTASDYFINFEYTKQIGGKTGTAQVSTIDLENNSWFVCFAPYDELDPTVKPEIAVVVYVPHGYQGGLSTFVAQDIIKYYMDQKKIVAEQTIPDSNTLVY